MKVHIQGNYVDSYTWDIRRIDKIVEVKSIDSAYKWAKQSYYKANINRVEEIK